MVKRGQNSFQEGTSLNEVEQATKRIRVSVKVNLPSPRWAPYLIYKTPEGNRPVSPPQRQRLKQSKCPPSIVDTMMHSMGRRRTRLWSGEEKREICRQTGAPGVTLRLERNAPRCLR